MATHSIYSITSRPSPRKPTPGDPSSSLGEPPLVVPGELIASSKYWMRGHGTFLDDQPDTPDEHDEDHDEDEPMDSGAKSADGLIRSTLAGSVERINKLVSVRGLRGRYRPEVGDLVIGRITEVQSKRKPVQDNTQF